MAWTKIDDPTMAWTTLSRGGHFVTPWFHGWFLGVLTSWTKTDNPTPTWTVV